MNNAIALDQVHKSYGSQEVLGNMSLQVPHGSVVGLLGRNGAGKTTLMKAVLGLLRVDRGCIRTLGEDPWNLSNAAKADIGYVQQGMRPYPWLPVGQLVDYTASFYPKWDAELAEGHLKQWGIAAGARVGSLSEGEAQKLLIILSIAHGPKLMVFDEPVASLDPLSRREFLKTILKLVTERECTVFFSTHITTDVERVADRVAVLKGGALDFWGGTDDLKDEVKRVRIRGAQRLPALLGIDGIVSSVVSGSDAILTVRGFNAQKHHTLTRHVGGDIGVEDLNLEEIFLEITQ